LDIGVHLLLDGYFYIYIKIESILYNEHWYTKNSGKDPIQILILDREPRFPYDPLSWKRFFDKRRGRQVYITQMYQELM
jgi:hypothetical protein